MKRNNTAFGALHPILFFTGIYTIALFLAFFVCRTVFYSLNDKDEAANEKVVTNSGNFAVKNNPVTAAVYK